MFRYRVDRRDTLLATSAILVCLTLCAHAQAQNIVSLKSVNSDQACGPKCLIALMKVTGTEQADCGIRCIYELIDKEPFKPTSLGDIKNAAQKLGFSAIGYRLTIRDLRRINDYMILPMGSATGTADDPLHFILAKQVTKDYVIIINTKTVESQAIGISDFRESWVGYALVISAGKGRKPLRKMPDNVELIEEIQSIEYDQTRDFGHVDSGARLEHTFTIHYETREAYRATVVSKSCSCLSARLGNDTNGNTTITLELHVDKPGWQEVHAVVLLEPEGTIKKYAVRAYGKDSFRITPKIGHIEALNGGMVEYPVKIDYFTGSDDIVKYHRMSSDIADLEASRVTSYSTIQGDAATFSFEIVLLFDAGKDVMGVKDVGGTLNFVLNTGKGERIVPLRLTATIGKEKCRLTPEKVFIAVPKSSGVTARRRAIVEFLTEGFPSNISIRCDNDLPLEISTSQVGKSSYAIDIVIESEELQDTLAGMHKGEISIVPEGLCDIMPVTLPVSLFVRE